MKTFKSKFDEAYNKVITEETIINEGLWNKFKNAVSHITKSGRTKGAKQMLINSINEFFDTNNFSNEANDQLNPNGNHGIYWKKVNVGGKDHTIQIKLALNAFTNDPEKTKLKYGIVVDGDNETMVKDFIEYDWSNKEIVRNLTDNITSLGSNAVKVLNAKTASEIKSERNAKAKELKAERRERDQQKADEEFNIKAKEEDDELQDISAAPAAQQSTQPAQKPAPAPAAQQPAPAAQQPAPQKPASASNSTVKKSGPTRGAKGRFISSKPKNQPQKPVNPSKPPQKPVNSPTPPQKPTAQTSKPQNPNTTPKP